MEEEYLNFTDSDEDSVSDGSTTSDELKEEYEDSDETSDDS